VVLRLPADTVGTFFVRAVASFTCKVEIALIKANKSCLDLTLRTVYQNPVFTSFSFPASESIHNRLSTATICPILSIQSPNHSFGVDL